MAADSPVSIQLTRFGIGDARYAFDIMKVREVLQPAVITAVPGAPAFIEGLIELRGDFLPVVDLRRRLGRSMGPEAKIVVAYASGRRVGFVVDQVFDVVRVETSEIRSVDELARTPALAGIIPADDGPVMLLDPDALLSALEVSALDDLPMGASS